MLTADYLLSTVDVKMVLLVTSPELQAWHLKAEDNENDGAPCQHAESAMN
jgi:hypothetical protein